MSFHSEEPNNLNIPQDCSELIGNEFLENIGGDWGSGSKPISESLVLDNEKGQLMKACGRVGKKVEGSAKTVAALKSHSEAERRRRERINAHLATLRGLVPSNEKMDKATLLAEVIRQVKELKESATQVSDRLYIPLDYDEVRVEEIAENTGEGTLSFRASLCCSYRPGLFSDVRQAFDALHLHLVRSEISTLDGRVKNVLFFTSSRNGDAADNATESRAQLMSSVNQALSSILDKTAASLEYSPQNLLSSKRQRISYFESSSSSS